MIALSTVLHDFHFVNYLVYGKTLINYWIGKMVRFVITDLELYYLELHFALSFFHCHWEFLNSKN